MDTELQKIILRILVLKLNGRASLFDIKSDDLVLEYWLKKENLVMDECCNEFIRFHDSFSKGIYYDKFNNQLNLLEQEGKIVKQQDIFQITPRGYAESGGFFSRQYFYLQKSFKKDPLPILISILSLVISVFALLTKSAK